MFSILIIIFYLVVRVGFNAFWDSISPIYSYLFEIVFVVSTYFYFRSKKTINLFIFENKKESSYRLVPWLFMGMLIYKLANYSSIIIPFEFNNKINIFSLLVLAPILEEFIFRLTLFEAVSDFITNKEIQIWISALFFSIGHLISILLLPMEYRPFVLYQSVYVIILGIGASKMRQESKGMIGSILVHFLFNFGFYLGSLI